MGLIAHTSGLEMSMITCRDVGDMEFPTPQLLIVGDATQQLVPAARLNPRHVV